MNRRTLTLIVALIPLFVLGAVGSRISVPFVALSPGPTVNTLGEIKGQPVVEVSGVEVDPISGHLNMTTVGVHDGLTFGEALRFWLDEDYGVVPRSTVFEPGVSREEIEQANQRAFTASENKAELAALRYLDLPIVTLVAEVGEEGPSHDVLRPGDEIVSIDDTPISTPDEVLDAVSTQPPGHRSALVVRRDGAEQHLTVTLAARPDDPERGYLGITPRRGARPPMRVSFHLEDIGGPSAGLMFSLALIEKLTPGELDGGRFVAGTGSIEPDGAVGPIGGIQYKMRAARAKGAETFLVPAANCAAARQQTPDGLRLIKVENLAGAVRSLEDLNAGRQPVGC